MATSTAPEQEFLTTWPVKKEKKEAARDLAAEPKTSSSNHDVLVLDVSIAKFQKAKAKSAPGFGFALPAVKKATGLGRLAPLDFEDSPSPGTRQPQTLPNSNTILGFDEYKKVDVVPAMASPAAVPALPLSVLQAAMQYSDVTAAEDEKRMEGEELMSNPKKESQDSPNTVTKNVLFRKADSDMDISPEDKAGAYLQSKVNVNSSECFGLIPSFSPLPAPPPAVDPLDIPSSPRMDDVEAPECYISPEFIPFVPLTRKEFEEQNDAMIEAGVCLPQYVML